MGNKLKDRIRLNSIYGLSLQNPVEEFEYTFYKCKDLEKELRSRCDNILSNDIVTEEFKDQFKDQFNDQGKILIGHQVENFNYLR